MAVLLAVLLVSHLAALKAVLKAAQWGLLSVGRMVGYWAVTMAALSAVRLELTLADRKAGKRVAYWAGSKVAPTAVPMVDSMAAQ